MNTLRRWSSGPPQATPPTRAILSPITRIGLLILLMTTLLGCGILNKGDNTLVRKLDAVMLTTNDLPPTMELDVRSSFAIPAKRKFPPIVDSFSQSWDSTRREENIDVSYWLFRSVEDAKTAAGEWMGTLASAGIYRPEPRPENVIGDATWRIENNASIWFVKNNVLVFIMGRRPKINQLPFTRSVARKIEAKINTALNQP